MQLTGSKNGGVTLGGAAQSCEFGLNFHSHSHHLDYLAYLDYLANLDHLDYFAYLAYLANLAYLDHLNGHLDYHYKQALS